MKLLILILPLFWACSESNPGGGIEDLSHIKEITLESTLYFQFSDTIPQATIDDILDTNDLGVLVKNTVEPCNSISIKHDNIGSSADLFCFSKLRNDSLIPYLFYIQAKSIYNSDDTSEIEFRKYVEDNILFEIHSKSTLGYEPIRQKFKSGTDTIHFVKK